MSDQGGSISSPGVRSSISSPPLHGSPRYQPSPSTTASNPTTPRISVHPHALFGGILPALSGHQVHPVSVFMFSPKELLDMFSFIDIFYVLTHKIL